MKRILSLVVFIVLFLASTNAFADSAYNWTGPYVGLQGSYYHGDTKWEWMGTGNRNDHTINGWMGGLFLGYNYQFPVNVVVGLETDINYGKIYGSTSATNPSWLANTEANWLGSTRFRVGYAVWRFLPYVAAGVAYGRAKIYDTNISTGVDYGETNTYFGWTPSAGLEFAITKNLLARAEYSYYDLGKKQSLVDMGPSDPVESTITFDGIKFGLMWKFGGAKEAAAAPPPPVEEMKKAPEAAPEVEKKMLNEGRARINVEFDFDKSDVKPQYNDEIKNVVDFMVKYPDTKVAIEGHTDSIGTKEYNQKLSQRRADSVKNYIVDKFNIDGKRLKSEGYGLTRPIADNKTAEGRQQNRRVESVLIK